MTAPSKLLEAARAEHIPEGWSDLWYVAKAYVEEPMPNKFRGRDVVLPAGTYTHLFRVTESTLYHSPPGTVVMEDTPFELRTHLQFMMQARGRVLVTGLGLGCVVRGLLANPAVEHVTVIERSKNVLKLVRPYLLKDESGWERLEIVEADALEWTEQHSNGQFDCAWHDLWTEEDAGEEKLELVHARLFFNCRDYVQWQGAWGFPRKMTEWLKRKGLRLI